MPFFGVAMTKLISIMPALIRLIARVVRFESGVDG